MSKIIDRIKRKGFTLVELLVVIAIIGILVSIVMPAITDALTRGKLTQMAANGRNLIQTLMSQETMDIYTSRAVVWPKARGSLDPAEGEFDSSTSYFGWLVTNEIMNVNFNYFAGPGVPAAPSEESFLGGGDRDEGYYNAWCMVGNVDSTTSETTPVLFTKNLGKDDDEDGQAYDELRMDDFRDQDSMDELFVGEPFQEKGFVFVTKGGAAFAPFKDDMRVANFTNIFKVYRPGDDDDPEYLPVLRPNSTDSGSDS